MGVSRLACCAFVAAALVIACGPLDGALGNGSNNGTITTGGPAPGQFSGTNVARATAEAFIRKQVKDVVPVLLPAFVPNPLVQNTSGSYSGFSITYGAGQTTVTILTGTAYPAAYHPTVPVKVMKFRSDRVAVYMAKGDANTSFITWNEPGHSIDKTCQCVRYTILATGLSQADFYKVADSLG